MTSEHCQLGGDLILHLSYNRTCRAGHLVTQSIIDAVTLAYRRALVAAQLFFGRGSAVLARHGDPHGSSTAVRVSDIPRAGRCRSARRSFIPVWHILKMEMLWLSRPSTCLIARTSPRAAAVQGRD